MKNFLKNIYILLLFLFFISCAEKSTYTGKIINFENKLYSNYKYKEEVLKNLGIPSFIDPIEKKYFYFSEKKISKNFFDNKITERKLIVFQFNSEELIISLNEFNLDDANEINLIKEKTSDEIIKKGLLERVFGGVGAVPRQTTQ